VCWSEEIDSNFLDQLDPEDVWWFGRRRRGRKATQTRRRRHQTEATTSLIKINNQLEHVYLYFKLDI
jgi:hypothetical protein